MGTTVARFAPGRLSHTNGNRLNQQIAVARQSPSSILTRVRRLAAVGLTTLGLAALGACGPRPRVPSLPSPRAVGADTGRIARLARSVAPVLYLQPDESFPLIRAVAIVHPTRRIIAYHLLWKDDVHGAWIPHTIPTDEEIVWVGYDKSGAPTDVWTYWHGAILHAPWRGRQAAIYVQWGKHGSLPAGIRESDLPRWRKLNSFYAFTYLFPDLALSAMERPGPVCFCHTYRRYREFDRPVMLANHLDFVVVAYDPRRALGMVFGQPYSEKPWWPWKLDLEEVKGLT